MTAEHVPDPNKKDFEVFQSGFVSTPYHRAVGF